MKIDKKWTELWVPIICSFITAFIVSISAYYVNSKSIETQIDLANKANENQIRISRESNKTQMESVQKTIEAQMKGVKSTNENTLRSIDLNYKHLIKQETKKSESDKIIASRILIADIDFRLKFIESYVNGLQSLINDSSKRNLLNNYGFQFVLQQNYPHYDVDYDFVYKNIRLLPDNTSTKLARVYGLLKTMSRFIDQVSKEKSLFNEMSLLMMKSGLAITENDKKLYSASENVYTEMNKVLLNASLLLSVSIIIHGYDALGDLHRLLNNDDQSNYSLKKSKEYRDKVDLENISYSDYLDKYLILHKLLKGEIKQ